jgi:hypothetical protein
MGRLIIIEGPDASGKTTLARYIANKHQSPVFHSTWTPRLASGIYDYMSNVLDNAEWCLKNLNAPYYILDRGWPSETVYAPVFKRSFTTGDLWERSKNLGAINILCLGNIERYKQNIDPAHPYKVDEYLSIMQGYHRWNDDMCKLDQTPYIYTIESYGHDIGMFLRHIDVV